VIDGRKTAALLTALMVCLTACSGSYDMKSANNYSSQRVKEARNASRAYQTQQQYGTVVHDNTKMELSQKLIQEVQNVEGVNSAIVILTDRYAYTAITLDNTATGTKGARARREVNNKGTSLGRYNPFDNNQTADPRELATGFNNYETVQNHEDLSHAFKQRIAETIRMAQPNVHDVFISANRDFVNRMNVYAQESWKGHSLQPYVAEFNQLVTDEFGTGPVHVPWNANR
jgi:hypothetical protein